MKYDPAIHHRRSIRLDGFDYASPGAYFVTIVVRNRECLLGEVTADGVMRLNGLGQATQTEWEALPRRFPRLSLDEYVIMPNHLHGLLVLLAADTRDTSSTRDTRKGEAFAIGHSLQTSRLLANASPLRNNGTQRGSLAAMVQSFKSLCSRRLNGIRRTPGAAFWHRNYWEHVVRGEADLAQIRAYIQSNPARWALDQLHPSTLGRQ